MGSNGSPPKSLSTLAEDVAKLLIWLGIAFIAAFSYKLGQRNGLHFIAGIPKMIYDKWNGTVTSSPLPGTPDSPFHINAHVVLVGTYDRYADAVAMRKRLGASRINGYINTQGGRHYLVVGPYTSQTQATRALKYVQSKGFPAQLISPRSNY